MTFWNKRRGGNTSRRALPLRPPPPLGARSRLW